MRHSAANARQAFWTVLCPRSMTEAVAHWQGIPTPPGCWLVHRVSVLLCKDTYSRGLLADGTCSTTSLSWPLLPCTASCLDIAAADWWIGLSVQLKHLYDSFSCHYLLPWQGAGAQPAGRRGGGQGGARRRAGGGAVRCAGGAPRRPAAARRRPVSKIPRNLHVLSNSHSDTFDIDIMPVC